MGQVFLAEQESPHRQVALKVLRRDLDTSSLAHRFRTEIQALGRLNHPGIAQIYEHVTSQRRRTATRSSCP